MVYLCLQRVPRQIELEKSAVDHECTSEGAAAVGVDLVVVQHQVNDRCVVLYSGHGTFSNGLG